MLTWAAKKLFGTANDRALRRLESRVPRINAHEPKLAKLSDAELQAKTPEFKQRLANGEPLDNLLDEAFAVCREAGKRALSMRHYDVQLIGGMVLHRGNIAEMKTGEGKTLVATLPIYLNALEGKGVHLITVNDYLAKRDAEWMGQIYNFLGLSVGAIVNQQNEPDKRKAYQCDICYGQNNEFGFDYLRDNMKLSALDYAQRPLHYAIVDEVDSILIDEARTPLIISGSAEPPSQLYRTLNELVAKLRKDEHYAVDEKAFTATLTDEGVELIQQLMQIDNLYDPTHVQGLHIVYQLLRAHTLYKRDVHYMVSPGGEVLIIDEFTGRVLRGRRWSDGLHQAVEAKENVRIQTESRTMATITFQNLFRLYKKLAGMTGTAQTEAQEFHSTYKLDVVAIPTNRVVARQDDEDVVYKTEREKFTAVIADILEQNTHGRPVLVGTTSVEKSTAISRILTKKKVPHHVLNAKHHENEAYVVAQAGRKGAITVSTNMAGRGTDIILGGNPEMLARLEFREANRLPEAEPDELKTLVTEYKVKCAKEQAEVVAAGGLHIVGTERHESRRIDNQLRGRAGRQGDPGSSRFYLSLEDDLMRIFGGERVKNLMDRMGMPDDEPIEHPWVTKSVENAQRKVEERNFDTRKNLLEYDDVMNAQRRTVYALRQSLLLGRYSPEELDELGKPTGEARDVEVVPSVQQQVAPIVAQLINMFSKEPTQSIDAQGNPRPPTVNEMESMTELVEVEGLQREIYEGWGVKVDLDVLRKQAPARAYEMIVELACKGLSEQRERILDLIDRVVAAMMEESCPPNRAPEDWDWKGIHQGFREHFSREIENDVDQLGDVEHLVRVAFERAQVAFLAKEQNFGLHQLMRLFHALYIEEIDRAWVDHLTNMEHLRDGIGLRGYGQRDPKQEYKKEGYDLFLSMVAKASSNVLAKTFEFKAEGSAMAELEAQTQRHQEQIDHAQARHPEVAPRPMVPEAPPVTDEEPCPCGSGKAFRKCHGSALAEDEVQATA